jgi:hypothetical protein
MDAHVRLTCSAKMGRVGIGDLRVVNRPNLLPGSVSEREGTSSHDTMSSCQPPPEPPKSAEEKTGGRSAIGPHRSASPLGIALTPHPKTPLSSGNFGPGLALQPEILRELQTKWRRNQSVANSSPGADPCSIGKIQGNLSISDSPGATWSKIPQRFRGHRDRSAVIRNREYISMGRGILEDEIGLQATAMEPARLLCVLFIHPSGPAASPKWELGGSGC